MTAELAQVAKDFENAKKSLVTAMKSAEDLQDESTEELEANLANIDAINVKIRSNYDKEKAEIDADGYTQQVNALTTEIEGVRGKKMDLLKNANLPLPELSVADGDLIYRGFKWDNMSGAEQMKVATAIVRKLNPKCGFVLLDKLEAFDQDTLHDFGSWLETEGLQVIATRVSTGSECSILIQDGYVVDAEDQPTEKPTWKKGQF